MRFRLTKEQTETRFWSHVIKHPDDECWEWKGSLCEGYGQFNINHTKGYAHRFAWELYNKKKIPKRKQVCHTCDNRPCTNPKHLYCGTQQQNLKDRDKRSHHLLGHPKLHEGEIWLIRKLNILRKGSNSWHLFPMEFVARMFNVKHATIRRIWTQPKRLSKERTRV